MEALQDSLGGVKSGSGLAGEFQFTIEAAYDVSFGYSAATEFSSSYGDLSPNTIGSYEITGLGFNYYEVDSDVYEISLDVVDRSQLPEYCKITFSTGNFVVIQRSSYSNTTKRSNFQRQYYYGETIDTFGGWATQTAYEYVCSKYMTTIPITIEFLKTIS